MSRRSLNNNHLGASASNIVLENPMEMIKPKPITVSNYIPNEPIILTKEQWQTICDRTHDASLPFTVSITVIDKEEEEQEGVEVKESEYVPKRTKKSKK